jgi:hypothetical protein
VLKLNLTAAHPCGFLLFDCSSPPDPLVPKFTMAASAQSLAHRARELDAMSARSGAMTPDLRSKLQGLVRDASDFAQKADAPAFAGHFETQDRLRALGHLSSSLGASLASPASFAHPTVTRAAVSAFSRSIDGLSQHMSQFSDPSAQASDYKSQGLSDLLEAHDDDYTRSLREGADALASWSSASSSLMHQTAGMHAHAPAFCGKPLFGSERECAPTQLSIHPTLASLESHLASFGKSATVANSTDFEPWSEA